MKVWCNDRSSNCVTTSTKRVTTPTPWSQPPFLFKVLAKLFPATPLTRYASHFLSIWHGAKPQCLQCRSHFANFCQRIWSPDGFGIISIPPAPTFPGSLGKNQSQLLRYCKTGLAALRNARTDTFQIHPQRYHLAFLFYLHTNVVLNFHNCIQDFVIFCTHCAMWLCLQLVLGE